MNIDLMRHSAPAVTDVYTDVNGLQNLKAEKNNDVALKKISEQFESMFISMLLKDMRSANDVFSEGNMFDSQESKFYRDMYDQQLSLTLSSQRGFGIAEAMYRQLSSDPNSTQNSTRMVSQDLPKVIREAQKINASNTDIPIHIKALPESESFESEGRTQISKSPEDFISKVLNAAESASKKLGVEKEILIAQAALETGWGKKVFSNKEGQSSFNLFNIKANEDWQGDSVSKKTLEFLDGQFSTVVDKFRSYGSIDKSFEDFTQLMQTSGRYLPVIKETLGGLDFIEGIHKAGYATDPNYVSKIDSVYQSVKKYIHEMDSSGAGL